MLTLKYGFIKRNNTCFEGQRNLTLNTSDLNQKNDLQIDATFLTGPDIIKNIEYTGNADYSYQQLS
jgi:hypothetical protein